MKKIFVLKNSENHFWYSVNIISHYIEKALEKADVETELLETINGVLTLDQLEYILEESVRHDCYVFFLSDHLNQAEVAHQCSAIENLKYLIPIYGNLTIEIDRWHSFNNILKGKEVLFLCASDRSVEQVKRLTADSNVCKLVYPIQVEDFVIKDVDDEIIRFIYTGRITAQKNIFSLIKSFLNALKIKSNIELHIAGPFHERGYHFHGYKYEVENFKGIFYELVKKANGKIIYHDNLNQRDLLALYQKTDVFVSASTYHDEDFGVSALQAGLTGHKLILSNWGGHASFPGAELVNVYVDEYNIPQVDSKDLFNKIIKAKKCNKKTNPELARYVSYENFSSTLISIVSNRIERFEGISNLYENYLEKYNKSFPFLKLKNETNEESRNLYLRIYGSYLGLPRD